MNITYTNDGKVSFKCERYTKSETSRHQVACDIVSHKCPYYIMKYGRKYFNDKPICGGTLILDWVDYIKFKGILNDK